MLSHFKFFIKTNYKIMIGLTKNQLSTALAFFN